jgi:hypothetical protein
VIELVDDAPDGVLGLRVAGLVTTEEYLVVVRPALHDWLTTAAHLSVLAIVEHDFGYDPDGDWGTATDGVLALPEWRRLGVVTDAGWLRRLAPVASFFVPGKVRAFPMDRLDEARAWVVA